MLRFAFMGLRHDHMLAMHRHVRDRADCEVVAVCEPDRETREALVAEGKLPVTHAAYAEVFETVDFDAVALGDVFGARGGLAIEALRRGKHVLADKPLCTALEDLDEIERLAKAKGLVVGCMLTMRDSGLTLRARELYDAGAIGEIHAIAFGGQHQLNYGRRPGWYFEEGRHGGTINDIAVHAVDCIPWITGKRIAMINVARSWNTRRAEAPAFKDAAQLMLTLENGCGVIGDVSYLLPDAIAGGNPLTWRFTFWGREGVMDYADSLEKITVWKPHAEKAEVYGPAASKPAGYLEAFVRETRGERHDLHLSMDEVIRASRTALLAQKVADEDIANVSIGDS
jgi:predicted dehydrogenase